MNRLAIMLVACAMSTTGIASDFESYKKQMNKQFESFKGGGSVEEQPVDSSDVQSTVPDHSGKQSDQRSADPCDTNTGYGCTKTVRDDQLQEIMADDDANFSSSSESSDDSDTSSGDRGDGECKQFGYGCTSTVRDQQYLDALEDDGDGNYSSNNESNEDIYSDTSSTDDSSDYKDSSGDRSGNPCDTNTGYGCTKTVRDDQLQQIMADDDANFSASSSETANESSESEEPSGDRGEGECTQFGYGCTSTVRDQMYLDALEDDGDGNSSSEEVYEDDNSDESYESDDQGYTTERAANAQLVGNTQKAQGALTGKRYALIIAINQYETFSPLKTAVNDAEGVKAVLEQNYGFSTELILNKDASRDNIISALNRYRKTLTSDDDFLIYYAGHGLFIESTDASYWLPYNALRDDNTQWIESKSITDHLKLISANNILVVADSCYSGTISRSVEGGLAEYDSRNKYLDKMASRTSRVLISSGANEPVKDGGGGNHSVFAKVFINALKNPASSAFTANELLTHELLEPVAGQVEQTPEFKVIRNSGHQGGDFVFRRL